MQYRYRYKYKNGNAMVTIISSGEYYVEQNESENSKERSNEEI